MKWYFMHPAFKYKDCWLRVLLIPSLPVGAVGFLQNAIIFLPNFLQGRQFFVVGGCWLGRGRFFLAKDVVSRVWAEFSVSNFDLGSCN